MGKGHSLGKRRENVTLPSAVDFWAYLEVEQSLEISTTFTVL